ncbi:MAG TPA: hypothetical protein VF712_20000 [Thermoleophilaceae bacterium]|jgi:hypothetical protein
MRSLFLALALAALVAGGCGDGDSGGGQPERKPVTAASFVACFDRAGYTAKKPAPREESVLAFQAKQKGYRVEPVNVTGAEELVPAAFLVFFESPQKAGEAIKELKATSLGGVGIVTRGPVVIGYTDEEERALVEPAINRCTG